MVPHAVREAALGLGVPNWLLGVVNYRVNGLAGHYHRLHVGLCPRGRRDSSAAVYGARQLLLERGPEPAQSPLCRYRFTFTRSRPTMSGTGWPGPERWF